MNKSKWTVASLLLITLLIGIIFVNHQTPVARGKGSPRPLPATNSRQQAHAQSLALADVEIQALTAGQRSEVMGVRHVGQHVTPNSQQCTQADCRQVEIYNFDTNTAVVAIVNLDTNTVLDVMVQPNIQPGTNQRLNQRALEIAFNAPEVIDALGYQPTQADMVPVAAGLLDSSCSDGHYCVGPTFLMGDRVLWAIVDLTADELAGIGYTNILPDGTSELFTFDEQNGCPAPGQVTRDGWQVDYEVTGTDGLRVYNVTYNGVAVLTSAKLLEWHVDYNGTSPFGFRDFTGCSLGGGGFPIGPYGDTQVVDLMDGPDIVGFEIVQDFRMSRWGDSCNYRYDQHMQFFNDGRFRVDSGAYGKGCGTKPYYRPVLRIDMAVNGDDNDTFAYFEEGQWQLPISETYRTPYPEIGHGQHATTTAGFNWLIGDSNGTGFLIAAETGQNWAGSRGDNPFVYVTRHHPDEGDADLGAFPSNYCCFNDERQGPDTFINDEAVQDSNIVLWYVPQFPTDAIDDENGRYCWTVNGEPDPETYPCFGGPTFVPFTTVTNTATASFTVSNTLATAVFSSTSQADTPVNHMWDFGDGSPTVTSITPTHRYATSGTYTVTLSLVQPITQQILFTTATTITIYIPSQSYIPIMRVD